MTEWLAANIGTIAVAVIVAAVVTLVVIKMYRDKKRGVSSCGCDCGSCALHGQCHKK